MKSILTIATSLMLTTATMAQQAIWGVPSIISPEIHENNTVTFRFEAPNADTVQITGDFLPTQKFQTPQGEQEVPGIANLTKGEKGIWQYTTDVLASELYSYSFFVDGLKVTDPNNVYTVRDCNTITNIFIIGGGRADNYKVNDVAHGTVQHAWYDSPTLGMKRRLTVYTPAGYESSGEKYPVFYLLHGMGGDEEAWTDLGRAAQILDNLIAQGKAQPMIVVMTNGNASEEAAPGETHNGLVPPTIELPKTMEGSFEEAFKDVISFVEKTYRTKTEKKSRAIAGLSMGGYHSMHISHFYPEMFDYVGLFSAALWAPKGGESPVYKDVEGQLAKQFKTAPALYYIAIGDKDFLYQANVDYRKQLDEKGYKYEYFETGEGHIWKNWRIYLTEFCQKIFK